jgi:phosphoglucosamine mutase
MLSVELFAMTTPPELTSSTYWGLSTRDSTVCVWWSIAPMVPLAPSHPDGWNINADCGSTHLSGLIERVREFGADVGFAHDGDADRCLAVSSEGEVVDGDHILAILAGALRDRGRLTHDTVVTTVMANMGFKLAMQAAGIKVVETAVGDRYVVEEMGVGGFALGGEQSGHIVLSEFATTGDGVLTALQVMAQVAKSGRSLADLAAAVEKLPQVLVNVSGIDKSAIASNVAVQQAVQEAEQRLAGCGRVLLRPSGTEQVVRVMVEAATYDDAEQLAGAIADVVSAELTLD